MVATPRRRLRARSARLLMALVAVSLSSFWAAGGHDLGGSVRPVSSSEPFFFLDVAFGDASHAWAVGHGRDTNAQGWPVLLVYSTSDAGRTWTSLASPPAPPAFYLDSVAAVDATHAWIAGDPGIWATSDGGTTWSPLTLPPGIVYVTGLFFTSASTGWAVAQRQTGSTEQVVMSTTDGGATWTTHALPSSSTPTGPRGYLGCQHLFFLDPSHGWIACTNQGRGSLVVYSTTDGGASWTPNTLSTAPPVADDLAIAAVRFISPSVGFAVGPGVYATYDGGATWTSVIPCGSFKAVTFADATHGWIAGSRCGDLHSPVLLATSDGGRTWTPDPLPQSAGPLAAIAASSPATAIAVGFASQNGGKATILSTGDGHTWVGYPDRLWMGHAYQDLLGRTADQGGLDYWLGILAAAPRVAGPLGLQSGSEFHGLQVDAMYSRLLGRPADPAGRMWWIDRLARGTTYVQATAQILASNEYFQRHGGGTDDGWLSAVYSDVLAGRPVDVDGLAFWDGQLATRSRSSIALALVSSTEGLGDRVQNLYQRYLHRAADAGGAAYWASVIQGGGNDDQVVAALLVSNEYYWVAAVY